MKNLNHTLTFKNTDSKNWGTKYLLRKKYTFLQNCKWCTYLLFSFIFTLRYLPDTNVIRRYLSSFNRKKSLSTRSSFGYFRANANPTWNRCDLNVIWVYLYIASSILKLYVNCSLVRGRQQWLYSAE